MCVMLLYNLRRTRRTSEHSAGLSGWDVNFQLTQFIGSEAETSIGVFKWAEEAAILVFSPWTCAAKPIQLYQHMPFTRPFILLDYMRSPTVQARKYSEEEQLPGKVHRRWDLPPRQVGAATSTGLLVK